MTETDCTTAAPAIPAPPTDADARVDAEMLIAELFPGNATGKVCVPVGGRPTWANGGYEIRHGWREYTFDYPSQRDALIDHAFEHCGTRDVFLCGSLVHKNRGAGSFKQAWFIGTDWDGDPADRAECIRRGEKLGAFATNSGTDGHLHIFVPLSEPLVRPEQFRRLVEGLHAYLPPGSDNKKTWNDVLRLPGTFNHKATVRQGDTGNPTMVTWAVHPNGERREPDELAAELGLTTVSAVPGPQEPRTATTAAGPMQSVNLDDHPLVRFAIDHPVTKTGGQEDRSETCFAIVTACIDSGLTLPQTEWATRQRDSVAERLVTSPTDVRRCWDKMIDSRQRSKFDQRISRESDTMLVRKKTDGRPQLWKAHELQPMRQSTFLAKHRIPYGAATILVGDEGIGKSLLWVLIAAAVTTGRALPAFGIPERAPADVILILTEDNWAEDVLPRLTVVGANLDRIHVICTEDDGTGSPTFPYDMHLITEAAVKPALVVVDAWLDTVPGALSVRDTQQSRTALHPWKEAAGKTGAAVMLLTHTNRLDTTNMRDKYGATASLRQKARMTLFALADPKDGTLIVGPDKANNSPGGTHASRFGILGERHFNPTPDHDGTVPSLRYLGATDKTIKQHLAEIMAADREQKRHRTDAEAWLVEFLADGPRTAADVLATGAQDVGLSEDQLKRAKTKVARSYAKPCSDGKQCWYWELLKPGGTPANSEGDSSA